MEVTRVYYNDDSILIPGHLIKKRFRKPVFYPFERKCGFDYETINDEELIVGLLYYLTGLSKIFDRPNVL